jgi:hypothetical protein
VVGRNKHTTKMPLSHNSGTKRVKEKQRRPQHAGKIMHNYTKAFVSIIDVFATERPALFFIDAATTTARNKMNGRQPMNNL